MSRRSRCDSPRSPSADPSSRCSEYPGRAGHRRRRTSTPVRRRRHRHPSGPGVVDAGRADERRAHGARRHPYTTNRAQLHTDESVLPRHHRARASWNYLVAPESDDVLVTYDITRLMRLAGPRRFMVTLGGHDRVDQSTVLAEMTYRPSALHAGIRCRARSSIRTRRRQDRLRGRLPRSGFHEDGAASGLRAAEHLGATWPSRDRRREVVPC